jgi:hypothetical protein
LSEDERVQIADLHRLGCSTRVIARKLGRDPSTISRELRRNADPVTGSRLLADYDKRLPADVADSDAAVAYRATITDAPVTTFRGALRCLARMTTPSGGAPTGVLRRGLTVTVTVDGEGQ